MEENTKIVTIEITMNNHHSNALWFKFLSNVTDYIQTIDYGMPITPNQLVTHAMTEADNDHYCLTSYTDMVSSMSSLGLLDIERVGRTFNGESVYERTE